MQLVAVILNDREPERILAHEGWALAKTGALIG